MATEMRLGGQNCDLESKMSSMRWTILAAKHMQSVKPRAQTSARHHADFYFISFFAEKKNRCCGWGTKGVLLKNKLPVSRNTIKRQ